MARLLALRSVSAVGTLVALVAVVGAGTKWW